VDLLQNAKWLDIKIINGIRIQRDTKDTMRYRRIQVKYMWDSQKIHARGEFFFFFFFFF